MGLFGGGPFLLGEKGKGGSVLRGSHRPFHTRGSWRDPRRSKTMVIPVEAKLKQIVEQQRDYPWPRPEPCPRCQEPRVWGHGFVEAYFDQYACPVLLRRFRCPGCGCVMRLRPKGYFERFQASIHRRVPEPVDRQRPLWHRAVPQPPAALDAGLAAAIHRRVNLYERCSKRLASELKMVIEEQIR